MTSGKSHRRQLGFTYLTALLLIPMLALGAVAIVEAWSHARQREKEAELAWIGNQYKQAIGLYYERSPGVKRYPERLEDLIEDKRFVSVQRYLRRAYVDPLTGKADWALVPAPTGGIMGVRSAATAKPIRVAAAGAPNRWEYVYVPPTALPTLK